MELLQLGLFGAVYFMFSTGYFMSFTLFYLLCNLILKSKINIENNNEPISMLFNTMHLLLNVSILSGELIIFKMRKNVYLNKVMQIYDTMNFIYLELCCKAQKFLCGCCTSKELKTQKEIDKFLDSISD
jgi:hypothetical protein